MRRRAAWGGLLGLIVGSIALAPGAGSAAASCDQPYEAWFVQESDDSGTPLPGGPVLGESLTHVLLGVNELGEPDGDLDGTPDGVSWEGGTLVLSRGDGVVRLEPPASMGPVEGGSAQVEYPSGMGDLDGDGQPEFSVMVGRGAAFRTFVVLGGLAPGTYDVGEVAVDVTLLSGGSVGDQDGDGADDVGLRSEVDDEVVIVRGPDVVAPGPGGVLADVPAPITTVPLSLAGILDLEGGAPVLAGASPHSDATRVQLMTAEPIELAVPSTGAELGAGGYVTASRFEGDRIVVLHQSWRNGGRAVMWNIDDPCTPFDPAEAPVDMPRAPAPAQPTAGDPTYTG